MGSSKDYIALPQSEKELDSSIPPPPDYEEKHTRFPFSWKLVSLLLTFVGLVVVGFCIHPNREHGHFEKVELGFPQDIQQHNHAQEALTRFMTRIVLEAEHGHPPPPPPPPHPHPHPYHHNRHGKHHGHYHSDEAPHHQNHHHHDHHHHHHHHSFDEHEPHHVHSPHTEHHHPQNHHQKREDDETVYVQKLPTHNRYQPPSKHQRREDDETVYIQKLPTHNRYQPPSKHQRRELADALTGGKQQQWSQSYRLTPSINTSLHILSAHVHASLMGNIRLRQDTTGIEQDIVINFRTNTVDDTVPIEISTDNFDNSFFVRARSAPVHRSSAADYSIDIVFPSSMTTMKKLNIHINNGTIRADDSFQVNFDSVKFSIIQGAMSIQKLAADRIMLGTYSGVISGTFQPNTKFAVGAYYGHSNVRLLQSSTKSDHCRHLHIAASSPHGISELALERGAFVGQFAAYRTLEHAPKVNFSANDKELYEYQVVDQVYSGWFINKTMANQLIIHGADETTLTFE